MPKKETIAPGEEVTTTEVETAIETDFGNEENNAKMEKEAKKAATKKTIGYLLLALLLIALVWFIYKTISQTPTV